MPFIDKHFLKDVVKGVLFATVAVITLSLVIYFTSSFWTPDTSEHERFFTSVRLGLPAFVAIVPYLLISALAGFVDRDRSRRLAIVASVVSIFILLFSLFAVFDRLSWGDRMNGMINISVVPSLQKERLCQESVLLEFSADKDNTVIRCGGVLYPTYDEFTIPTKVFLSQLPDDIKVSVLATLKKNTNTTGDK